jgi:AmpD protein
MELKSTAWARVATDQEGLVGAGEGWHAQARVLASPNFNARPPGMPVTLIVLHSISLPPGCFGGEEVERLFTNRLDFSAHPYFEQLRGVRVSSHFFIRRDGELVQFVACEDRAWHAGTSVWRGRSNCNDFSLGIEMEGLEGGLFQAAQYQSLIGLLPTLAQQYPIDSVAGHEHVAPGRKADPGPGFDWARLRAGVGWPAHCFPPSME